MDRSKEIGGRGTADRAGATGKGGAGGRNGSAGQGNSEAPDRSGDRAGADDRDSTELLRERYQELIDELRVVLPGVQVLFAFLITAPFSGRFSELDDVQRSAYSVALIASTVALVLLLSPVAYHRLASRQHRSDRIAVTVRLKLGGLAFLGVSMTAAMLAVAGFVYSNTVGAIAAGALAVSVVVAWVALPLARSSQVDSSESHRPPGEAAKPNRPDGPDGPNKPDKPDSSSNERLGAGTASQR